MSDASYIGDYFFYSPEMAAATRRIEAMTNPIFCPGSMAGAAWLRGGNFLYGSHAGMTREELDRMWEAEKRK